MTTVADVLSTFLGSEKDIFIFVPEVTYGTRTRLEAFEELTRTRFEIVVIENDGKKVNLPLTRLEDLVARKNNTVDCLVGWRGHIATVGEPGDCHKARVESIKRMVGGLAVCAAYSIVDGIRTDD